MKDNSLEPKKIDSVEKLKKIDLAIWAKSKGFDPIVAHPNGIGNDYKYQYRLMLFYKYYLSGKNQISIENARSFVKYLDENSYSGRFIEYFIREYRRILDDLIEEITGIGRYWTGTFIRISETASAEEILIQQCQILRNELFDKDCFRYLNDDNYFKFIEEREMLYQKEEFWEKEA